MSMPAQPLEQPVPGRVFLSRDMLAARVQELGAQIGRDYHDRDLVLVTVLKGAVIFLADLSRALTVPHRLEFMAISSYRGASPQSAGGSGC